MNAPAKTADNPVAVFRKELDHMTQQFATALPAHIPAERFARVVMTAIQNSPKLLKCTRQSLWNACMKAAQDGLLPDGRDGAIVPYGETEDGQRGSDIAQWMPMIGGLRKKARNSGEIRDWYVEVVYAGDHFHYQKGDDPRLEHVPVSPGQRHKNAPHYGIIAAYSIAIFKDGSKSVPEVMWIEDIIAIRNKSKAKKGPWSDPAFFPEMCKKTVARRHSKTLPMSTDLDDLVRRDDELYDLSGAKDDAAAKRPRSLAGALDRLAGADVNGKVIEHKPGDAGDENDAPHDGDAEESASDEGGAAETAEPTRQAARQGGSPDSDSTARGKGAEQAAGSGDAPSQSDPAAEEDDLETVAGCFEAGERARRSGKTRKALPAELKAKGKENSASSWFAGWDQADKDMSEAGS